MDLCDCYAKLVKHVMWPIVLLVLTYCLTLPWENRSWPLGCEYDRRIGNFYMIRRWIFPYGIEHENWHTKSLIQAHQILTLKRFSYCLAAFFAESLEARCEVENEDVVGAALTSDAPTTSEWSTILLPPKVLLILEFLRYVTLWWLNAKEM